MINIRLLIPMLLLLLAQAQTTQAGNSSSRKLLRGAPNETDDHNNKQDTTTNMKVIQRVIKEAIISSLMSKDGKVDPREMDSAQEVGFLPDEVKQLVNLAQQHAGDSVRETEHFLNSVQIIPKDATQYALHHVEIIPKEEDSEEEKELKRLDMQIIQRVIKEAIISSVNSEDGKVDAAKMQKAKMVGFTSDEVKQLVDLAKKNGDNKDIEKYLNSVQIIQKEATQYALRHIEIIPKEDAKDIIKTTERQQEDEKEDEVSVSPRVMIANALLSSLNIEVDPEAMERAVDAGFSTAEVRRLTRLARKKIDSDGNEKQVEDDLKEFRELKFPRSKEEVLMCRWELEILFLPSTTTTTTSKERD